MTRTLWKHIYTRPTRTQDCEVPLIIPAFRRYGRFIRDYCYIPREGKWEAWLPEHAFMRWMRAVAAEVRDSHWSLAGHIREYNDARRHLHQCARQLARERTLDAYRAYVRAWDDYALYIWVPWACTHVLEHWLTAELRKRFPHEWPHIAEGFAVPSQTTAGERLEDALLEWRIVHGSHKTLERLARKFGYLAAYSVNDSVWSADDLARIATSFTNPERELLHRKELRVQNRGRARWALSQLRRFQELHQVAATIQTYTWLRTDRVEGYKRAFVLVQPFYRKLETRLGWEFGWAGHCSYEEICTVLSFMSSRAKSRDLGRKGSAERAHSATGSFGGALPDRAELARRAKNQYVVYSELRQGSTTRCHPEPSRGISSTQIATTIISDSKEWASFLRSHVPGWTTSVEARELRGSPASPGHVRGRVRVILHLNDVPTMRRGEILIANMTHPDYMPAIKRAAAIVTDEGGVLCHAAVISRELKIPCIVGTGEATKAFKTGDRVEVDATKGIVRHLGKDVS